MNRKRRKLLIFPKGSLGFPETVRSLLFVLLPLIFSLIHIKYLLFLILFDYLFDLNSNVSSYFAEINKRVVMPEYAKFDQVGEILKI